MLINFLILFVLAIIVLKTPVIGKYVKIINTLIHEIGHALMAIVTRGSVGKIQLFANTEGAAWTSNRFWIGRFLTSIAGYPFASIMGFVFCYLITKQSPINIDFSFRSINIDLSVSGFDMTIYILILFLVISLVFWVRNLYGFFWMITFTALFGFILWLNNPFITENVVIFIVAVIVIEAFTTTIDIVMLSFKTPHNAGDAKNLAEATYIIPAQVWGIVFLLQAIYFGVKSILLFI